MNTRSPKKSGFHRYELHPRVLEALPAIGYQKPTPVQEKVIPLIIQRRNLLVEAGTGTGKTAAYGLPLISRLDLLKRSTQVLILTPSRELARQVEAAMRSFSTASKLRVEAIYGGPPLADSEEKVRSAPHILIAVPGRLKDVIATGRFDHLWRDIKYLVLDEADKMLELGFQRIVDNLISHVRNNVQVACFSATISEDVEGLIRERFYPIMAVRLSPKEALKNNRFYSIQVDGGSTELYLGGLLRQEKPAQALIFTSNRDQVHDIANFLRSAGYKTESYHGLLDQVGRDAVMNRFRTGQVQMLVATDLAARGLDIEDLPAVVNFNIPDDQEVYLHRCGRTGRAGKKGRVYNLVLSKIEQIHLNRFHKNLLLRLDLLEVKPVDRSRLREDVEKYVKAHFNRGKRDKIRPGDIVGFLTANSSIPADEIGAIAMYDTHILADIPESLMDWLETEEEVRIKGKKVRVSRYTLADQKKRTQAVQKKKLGVRDKAKRDKRG